MGGREGWREEGWREGVKEGGGMTYTYYSRYVQLTAF